MGNGLNSNMMLLRCTMQMVTIADTPSRPINAHMDTRRLIASVSSSSINILLNHHGYRVLLSPACPLLGGGFLCILLCVCVWSSVRMWHLRESSGWFLCQFQHWTPSSLYAHPHDFITQAAKTVIHKQIQCLCWCCPKGSQQHRQPNSHLNAFLRGKRNWVEKTENVGVCFYLLVHTWCTVCDLFKWTQKGKQSE